MKNFLKGTDYLFQGIALFYRDRSLWKYTAGPWGLLFVLYSSMAAVIFYYSTVLAEYLSSLFSSCPSFLRSLLTGGMNILALLLAAVIILTTLSTFFEIFGGLFFDKLIEKYEEKYGLNILPATTFQKQLKFTLQAGFYAAASTFLFLLILFFSLFLPLVGQLLLLLVMGKRLALSLLFPAGFLRNKDTKETRFQCRKCFMQLLGFGAAVYCIQLIPFVFPLVLPGMILGAAIFYNRELSEQPIPSLHSGNKTDGKAQR